MVTKLWFRSNAINILGLGSVEDAFLPDSMDHMIVEFWRNLPRSLWTVHSYHSPVLGTYMTDSTLSTSTLTWKRKTIRNVIFLKSSSIEWTAGLFNINILIAEIHIHVDLPLTPAVTLSVVMSIICVGIAFFSGTLHDLLCSP